MITLYDDEKYTVTNNVIRYGVCGLFMIVAIAIIVLRVLMQRGILKESDFILFDNKFVLFLVLIVLFAIALLVLFLKTKLSINAYEIKVSTIFTDITKKKSIQKIEIREFDPKEVSGLFKPKVLGARAYLFGESKMGVLITMKDGDNIFISSSEPQRLFRALKN